MEVWLSALLGGIRSALQWQVGLASGHEQPPQPAASPPPVPETPSSGRFSSKRKSGSLPRRSTTVMSRPLSRDGAQEAASRETAVLRKHRMSKIMAWQDRGEMDTDFSETACWLLDHVGEVLDLVCRIRFTESVESALKSASPKEGLEVSC